MKLILIVLAVLAVLFILSVAVYMLNLDMKLAAGIQPVIKKHYDRMKRDKRL